MDMAVLEVFPSSMLSIATVCFLIKKSFESTIETHYGDDAIVHKKYKTETIKITPKHETARR